AMFRLFIKQTSVNLARLLPECSRPGGNTPATRPVCMRSTLPFYTDLSHMCLMYYQWGCSADPLRPRGRARTRFGLRSTMVVHPRWHTSRIETTHDHLQHQHR